MKIFKYELKINKKIIYYISTAATFSLIVASSLMIPLSMHATTKLPGSEEEMHSKLGVGTNNWTQIYLMGDKALTKDGLKSQQTKMLEGFESKGKMLDTYINQYKNIPGSEEIIKSFEKMKSNDSLNLAGIILISIGSTLFLMNGSWIYYDLKIKK
ncbi:MAG: hypothetical protein ACRC4M_01590 [Mycoplasma sp.]